MKSSLRIVIGAVFVALVIGGITFYNRVKSSGGELVETLKRDKTPVRTEVLRPQDLKETVLHTGALAAQRDVTLTAEVVGKVIKKHKDLGDSCKRGQALLQLDAESYRIALLQADAVLRQGQAQLAQAKRDLERTRQLAKRSTVAAQTVERAHTAVQTARAGGKQAEASVRLARRNLRETSIRCPFDGTVAEVTADVGQLVSQQTPVARVISAGSLKLQVKVPAADLARIKVGQRVDLVDPANPSLRYTGTVKRLGVAGDRVTHNFPVEVTVPTKDGVPKPGQVVRSTIVVAEHRQVLTVPDHAIIRQGDAVSVFVVRRAKAVKSPLTLGPRVGQRFIVQAGLSAGDRVILVGHQGLEPGAAVEVVGEPGRKAKAPPRNAPQGDRPPKKK